MSNIKCSRLVSHLLHNRQILNYVMICLDFEVYIEYLTSTTLILTMLTLHNTVQTVKLRAPKR